MTDQTDTVAGMVEQEHFRVTSGSDFVHVQATKALAFDPKDWGRDLRTAIAEGLTQLTSDGRALVAQVWDRNMRVLDLENAVMYNVGLGPFGRFVPGGLWFRRHANPLLPEAILAAGPTGAQYAYAAVDPSALRLATTRDALHFEFQLSRPIAVRETWRAARQVLRAVDHADLTGLRLGMQVLAPVGTSAGAVKPLLDGIVSALHIAEDDGTTSGVLTRWGADAAELALLEGTAPLGPRRLITLSGERPSWNPADDLFDEIVVRACLPDAGCVVDVYRLG